MQRVAWKVIGLEMTKQVLGHSLREQDMHLATAIYQVLRRIHLQAIDRNGGAQPRIKESPTVGLEPTTTRLRALRSAG